MILQALYEYYRNHPDEFPKFGFARKEIKYMIVLEEDGTFVRLEDQFVDAKKKTGKMYPLPAEKKRSGTNAWMYPRFLWDNCGFLLGYDRKEDKSRNLQSFIKSIESVPDELKKDPGFHAVLEFYRRKEYLKVFDAPEWKQCAATDGCNMTFRLKSEDTPVAYRPAVVQYVSEQARAVGGKKGLCLITGKYGPIVKLMSQTRIPGSQASTSLVSFQEKQGYDSYGKTRCYNAPMSVEAEFACSTVFNHFLAKDSKNCFTLKKNKKSFTALFWVEKKLSSASGFSLEDIIFAFARTSADEAKDVTPIRTMCESVWKGKMPAEESSVRYCFLWMTPNNARISVRLWEHGTVGELARNLKRHFDDLGIVNGMQYPPLLRLLAEVVPEKDLENIPPGLPDKIIHAAFNGSMYPATWRNLCLSRISAAPKKKTKSGKRPEKVSPLQAAILKAFLNRKQRLSKSVSQHNTAKEIKMDYDPDNPNPAYQCGALFAVIVKTQEEAAPDVNRTVCDSYFSAASTRPGSVFARLLSLNLVHLKKIRQSNYGRYVNLEKAIQDIAVKFGSKFPGMLTPDERASFCLGYYQRRQLFFKEKPAGTDSDQEKTQDNQ